MQFISLEMILIRHLIKNAAASVQAKCVYIYLRRGEMGTSRSMGLCGEYRPGGVGVRLDTELLRKSTEEISYRTHKTQHISFRVTE